MLKMVGKICRSVCYYTLKSVIILTPAIININSIIIICQLPVFMFTA